MEGNGGQILRRLVRKGKQFTKLGGHSLEAEVLKHDRGETEVAAVVAVGPIPKGFTAVQKLPERLWRPCSRCPTWKVSKFVSQIIVERGLDYRTGVVHTTGYRFWEFDERFKRQLYEERAFGSIPRTQQRRCSGSTPTSTSKLVSRR